MKVPVKLPTLQELLARLAPAPPPPDEAAREEEEDEPPERRRTRARAPAVISTLRSRWLMPDADPREAEVETPWACVPGGSTLDVDHVDEVRVIGADPERDDDRGDRCHGYEGCLTFAGKLEWGAFVCVACPHAKGKLKARRAS